MKLNPINLDIEILGTLPQMNLSKEEYGILTPQQVIALASKMTYKSNDAIEMAIEILSSEQDLDGEIKKSLMNSARRGHASLSTSAYMGVLFMGASKFVDSLFTGAIFSSSLMPSGRRVPTDVDSIVAPDSIIKGSSEIQNVYYEASKNNILLYNELVEKGISKQDASKITQYGIKGGGFMVLPLETIISFKKEFENQGEWIPHEGNNFIEKLEGRLNEIGMDFLYWARNFAPRNTIPYPNIFTDPSKPSFINDLVEKNNIVEGPIISLDYFKETENFKRELEKLYKLQQEITKNPDSVKERWQELLAFRGDIINRYKDILSVSSLSNVSWRVWGEVKRHRTTPQQPESVYAAINRARKMFNNHKDAIKNNSISKECERELSKVFITPKSILKNNNYKNRWFNCVLSSFDAYNKLVEKGIEERDVIGVIPRGLKIHIHKKFDLYNLIEGYIPIRSCATAEPEMLYTTRKEVAEIKRIIPRYLERLIVPKCNMGWCPELYKDYEGCQQLDNFIKFKYDKEIHKGIHKAHKKLINNKLG